MLPTARYSFLHGCNVLYDLVKAWANTNSIVVADSYYASVQAALRLWAIGLRFIGTVKTAVKEFPMAYLSGRPMNDGRGDRHGVVSRDLTTGASMLAYCWVDRERRYFITTCSSLAPGPMCIQKRWRQLDPTPDAPPELIEVVVPQPAAAHIYYSACGKIDQHNRLRQSSLMLETKLKTVVWHRRVNMSIFSMCVVDAFLMAQACQGYQRWLSASDFIVALIDDLIENKYEQRNLRKRDHRRQTSSVDDSLESKTGILKAEKQLISATPTKRAKKCNPSTEPKASVCPVRC